MRFFPTIKWGGASSTMLASDDDGNGGYLGFEWFGFAFLVEIYRRRA